MKRIDNLTAARSQITRIPLPDGTLVTFTVNFNATTQRWMVDVLHEDFETRGVGIVVGPNILRAFRETIPFGLACTTTDGADPVLVDDFISGRATLFLLDSAEVGQVETTIMGAP